MAENYEYEKFDPEAGEVKMCPQDDKDGKETGKCILNLPKWFDENPEERIRLGWIKHIHHSENEMLDYDPQTEFIVKSTKQVDAWTVEDVLHVLKKSEDQLAFEEMLSVATWGSSGGGGFMFF